MLAFVIYVGWMASTWAFHDLPWWIHVMLGSWLIAWHGSLQHETIHGHPTRWSLLNRIIGEVPLSLWLPYGIYRESHIKHHKSDLTDPDDDPESFYLTAQAWSRLGPAGRATHWVYATMVGRMLLYPIVSVVHCIRSEITRLARGDRSHLRHWAVHVLATAAVLGWVMGVCQIPLWAYLLLYVYPGQALSSLRSYAEHRVHPDPEQRTIVVESKLLGLLFLNNNLHALHHRWPRLAWYNYLAVYRSRREQILQRNGHYWFSSYVSLFRRYGFVPKQSPVTGPRGQPVLDDRPGDIEVAATPLAPPPIEHNWSGAIPSLGVTPSAPQ
ncbi:MAG: fatty acid desaturase [Proteobacteria bacterium]|nr:fatty acid desaturase [Pseudomonadota bacterium]